MSSIPSGLAANAPDVEVDLTQSRLFNADLAPVPQSRRKWGMLSFAALWISMSACIPTYMLASSLIGGGMNWWQAVLTIFLGNLIVLVPMILNAHAGTRYGIPFPVYCRASFGTHGANVPAILRALVACGWFGIQTWIGGEAIYKICVTIFNLHPAPADELARHHRRTIPLLPVFLGRQHVRHLSRHRNDPLAAEHQGAAAHRARIAAAVVGVAARRAASGRSCRSRPHSTPGQPKAGQFWTYFFPALTGMVGFWATLSLNIPDFSRYAKSQRDQIIGQALGLPLTMALYAFIGVAVTSATTIIYGETIWDPVDVLTHFKNPVVLVVAMLALCIATLATNIAANVVSPANDFAHLAPRKISFRIGGLITGIVGILMMPWKLVADPNGYIFTWLIAYSALLGPIGGILIADYFVCRRCQLNVTALYQTDGEYRFTNGFSIVALISLVIGVLPSLPGFLVNINVLSAASIPASLAHLYNYAWFIGFAVAFTVYLALRKFAPKS